MCASQKKIFWGFHPSTSTHLAAQLCCLAHLWTFCNCTITLQKSLPPFHLCHQSRKAPPLGPWLGWGSKMQAAPCSSAVQTLVLRWGDIVCLLATTTSVLMLVGSGLPNPSRGAAWLTKHQPKLSASPAWLKRLEEMDCLSASMLNSKMGGAATLPASALGRALVKCSTSRGQPSPSFIKSALCENMSSRCIFFRLWRATGQSSSNTDRGRPRCWSKDADSKALPFSVRRSSRARDMVAAWHVLPLSLLLWVARVVFGGLLVAKASSSFKPSSAAPGLAAAPSLKTPPVAAWSPT